MDEKNKLVESIDHKKFGSIVLVGNHLPRKCGIATFTTHLLEAIADRLPAADCWAIAMNDQAEGYTYPPQVRLEINQDQLKEYSLAADLLNVSKVDMVCLQHEFGIFGGQRGAFILEFLRDLKVPIVTTLHTLLRDPDDSERHIIGQLASLSDRLVVMSARSVDFLCDIYHVQPDKIAQIPHGIPDVPLVESSVYKNRFGLADKKLLLTFGLLSPGKGIETVIRALPQIVKSYPNVVYMIVGSTHPHLQKVQGEEYRIGLNLLARELGVEDHVKYYEHFVADDELFRYIGAADIYLTPYLNQEQIISGALAYALGMGKAVVSTPYWHAQELLAEGRGKLFPFRDHAELARQLIDLLGNPDALHKLQHKAYAYCRKMTWENVADQYVATFGQARDKHRRRRPSAQKSRSRDLRKIPLPDIKLDHLVRMTDGVGILQHCKYTVPNRDHGYCVDDNARALIVAVSLQNFRPKEISLQELAPVYLSFLEHAFNGDSGMFRNFMSYDRCWLEISGSQDSHARALWALGRAVALGINQGHRQHARDLFHRALPAVEIFTSPRAIAFTIIGIHAFFSRDGQNDELESMCRLLSDKLMQGFANTASENWPWCEESLTYENARLPQALLLASRLLNDNEIMQTAMRALSWLQQVQQDQSGRYFAAIGNHGWYVRGGEKAGFDQQPIEASAMIAACIAAYNLTGDRHWADSAYRCLNWYLGENELYLQLYDHATGGCKDGLQPQSVNENQGAESTLCWLMSLLDIYQLRAQGEIKPAGNQKPARQSLQQPYLV